MPYTILLVGGTGVGKSSVVGFIANVLLGRVINHYDFDILDHANEQIGSGDRSQTKGARLYEFTSTNGIVVSYSALKLVGRCNLEPLLKVRILDTPGFAETRNVQQDEFDKKGITNQIRGQIDSVTAVLVLANGTVPRITVGVAHALSTLSEIFPSTLANNVAFMFTNFSTPLSWNFCQASVPSVLKDARQFKIDNPFALQEKYLKLKNDPNVDHKATLLKEVNSGEENALKVLVNFFDWLNGLQPQRIIAEQTRGSLIGLLKKAKEKVRKWVWNVWRILMGE